MEIKKWIIRNLGLKGSWKWAKKQMMKGKIVRCKHWTGVLKFKIDNSQNTLLQANFTRTSKRRNGNRLWETSNHHLCYEDFTDYEIFEWD